MNRKYYVPTLIALLTLGACAAHQSPATIDPNGPGFWLGLWHGFIFPIAAIVGVVMPDVAVYSVPNNGGWYDFGYFLGIVVFGVGANRSKKVVIRERPARRGTVIEHE